jgi:hypothetical protein
MVPCLTLRLWHFQYYDLLSENSAGLCKNPFQGELPLMGQCVGTMSRATEVKLVNHCSQAGWRMKRDGLQESSAKGLGLSGGLVALVRKP